MRKNKWYNFLITIVFSIEKKPYSICSFGQEKFEYRRDIWLAVGCWQQRLARPTSCSPCNRFVKSPPQQSSFFDGLELEVRTSKIVVCTRLHRHIVMIAFSVKVGTYLLVVDIGCQKYIQIKYGTGKSLSEAFILTSTYPQYDKVLYNDLPVQHMKTTTSEHVVKTKNNLCTQHVLSL